MSGKSILSQANQHEYASRAETIVPAHTLTKIAANQLTDERAQIDAHVENREAGIASRTAVILVQLSDHGADVGLEQTGTEHNQYHADEESLSPGPGHGAVATGNQHSAIPYCRTLTCQSICHPATRQREHVDTGCVQTVDSSGRTILQTQPTLLNRRNHGQNQNGAHTVIGKALPHFSEEQGCQTARMTEPFRCRHMNSQSAGTLNMTANRSTSQLLCIAITRQTHGLLRPSVQHEFLLQPTR